MGASRCLPHLLSVPSCSCECFKAPLCSPLTEVSSERGRCRHGTVRAGGAIRMESAVWGASTGLQIVPSGKPSLPKEDSVHARAKDKRDVPETGRWGHPSVAKPG